MPKVDTTLNQMVNLAGEMTEVAIAGQTAGLQLLAVELQALAHMMPGDAAVTGLAHHQKDEDIEADFDNMPV